MCRRSQVWVPALFPWAGWPGHFINEWCCGGLSVVPLQLKDPLELFVKRREFLLSSWFLYRCAVTLAIESDVKTDSSHPFSVTLVWPSLIRAWLVRPKAMVKRLHLSPVINWWKKSFSTEPGEYLNQFVVKGKYRMFSLVGRLTH